MTAAEFDVRALLAGDAPAVGQGRRPRHHAGRDVCLMMGGMVDWLERSYPVEREAARA